MQKKKKKKKKINWSDEHRNRDTNIIIAQCFEFD